MTPAEDAVRGYELALERAEHAREVWERGGRKLTLKQPNGIEGKHPLWSALLEAEAFLLRARAALKVSERKGRPAGSGSAPDRAARLRAVS